MYNPVISANFNFLIVIFCIPVQFNTVIIIVYIHFCVGILFVFFT